MNKDPIWKHILILHGNTYFIVYCDIRPFQSEANKRYIHINAKELYIHRKCIN